MMISTRCIVWVFTPNSGTLESQCDGNFQTSANISANHKTNCCELTYFWLVNIFVEGQNFCQTGKLLYKSTIELKVEVLGWKRYFEYHDQTFCIFIFFLPLDNVYVATDASLHFTRLRFLLPTLKIWRQLPIVWNVSLWNS